MSSGGKKKTTMAKLARENRLRERRLNKQVRKDARKQAASDPPEELASTPEGDADDAQESAAAPADDAARAFRQADPEPTDPRAKEVALGRLRDAPDEELAVFEGKLQDDALRAGASEQEMREAQRNHPGHGA